MRGAAVGVLVVAGCTARVVDFGGTEDDGGSTTVVTTEAEVGPGDTGSSGSPVLDVGGAGPATERFVSVLFVIDDSVSMGAPQVLLASTIGALLDPLDAAGVDYRLGFTTTDNGNVWCVQGGIISAPEAGNFVSSSCETRLPDFVSQQEQQLDLCRDLCPLDALTIDPTTTEIDPTPRVRPWLEVVDGVANVSVSIRDAIACVLPQGVAGCGFEQPLESMYKGIRRTQNAQEDEYGFFNPNGLAVVVFLTDEVDCSTNVEYDVIFDLEGNRVFWSSPDDPLPTSALCWNAGVQCDGPESGLSCIPQNYDVEGAAAVPEDLAVMRPVSRYIDVLRELGSVYVAAIDGVPIGYSVGQAEIVYSRVGDPTFLHDFGIDAACESGALRGVPPVRLAAVVESVNAAATRDLFSICEPDFGVHLSTIAGRILERLPS